MKEAGRVWKFEPQGAAFLMMVWLLLAMSAAHAVPSMGRQTGYSCTRCHTVFPELTPFGREFKLGAFAMSSGKWDESAFLQRIPVAGVLQVARSTARSALPDDAPEEAAPRDRRTILQLAGVYYGGKIADESGALVQYSYDGIERRWGMEMFDARYARELKVGGTDLVWGLTLNNAPTLADIYNGVPAWSFPHGESSVPMPAAAPMVDMKLAGQVGGLGAYALWNGLIYAEFDVYRTTGKGPFRFMSPGRRPEDAVSGTAPYWRIAVQRESRPHSFQVGAYGMVAKLPAEHEEPWLGTDRYRDVAVDGGYQYIREDHTVSAHATWIRERQDWTTSFREGLSSSERTVLKAFRADVRYHFRRKIGGGVQYFAARGDANELRYNTGEEVMGSANGSPNSKGWVAQVDYLPLESLKLGARYTAYREFNGGRYDYDGHGRNAKDNNGIFLFALFVF